MSTLPPAALPAPSNLRELFQLFSFYQDAEGLGGLIEQLNFDGVLPRQIYYALHDRAPERITDALAATEFEPRKMLEAGINAPEFQNEVLQKLLRAFPEKKRQLFVHIPKCAGTDLTRHITSRFLSISHVLAAEAWTSKPDLFAKLAQFARSIELYDEILVYGHIELGDYLTNVGTRHGDRIFTILRDPVELMISQANYAVTRLVADPEGKAPDSRGVLNLLGLERLPSDCSAEFLKELAVRAFRDIRITQPNRICTYLGKSATPDFASAMRHIITLNIELTDTDHYGRWLAEKWGLESTTRHNESQKFLSRDDVVGPYAKQTDWLTREDNKVFQIVSWALREKGTSSVTGQDIAEMLSIGDPVEFDAGRDEIRWPANGKDAEPSEPDERPDGADLKDLEIDFSVSGDSHIYRESGWAQPEAKHIWTVGNESRLQLDRPARRGDYVLTLKCAPFVWRDKIPTQRLTVEVNGVQVGSFSLKKQELLECPVPWDVIAKHKNMFVTFHHPDAARPREISGAPDDRSIAIAFQAVGLSHHNS
jgi:hypothetical protein